MTPTDARPPSPPKPEPTPFLDAATERDLLARAANGSEAALGSLLQAHMRLVVSVAKRYANGGVALEDLVAEGALALIIAARRFDRERPVRFATYARWWVTGYVRHYALANRRLVSLPTTRAGRRIVGSLHRTRRDFTQKHGRPPTHEETAAILRVGPEDVALVETMLGERDLAIDSDDRRSMTAVSDAPSPEQLVEEAEARRRAAENVSRAFRVLNERERRILDRRLLADEPDSLSAIGAELGVSRERVRQLQRRAESKLRSALEAG